jgi:hypothetical protein
VSEILRLPVLLFAAGVEQLRHLPGARRLAPVLRWAPRLLLLVAFVLGLLWAMEVSPQRISLAELAAGKLSSLQSWIIVSGNLADEPGSSGFLHLYRLTDDAAPNAYLIVRSRVVHALGPATISGRVHGGREPVPEGYAWSAPLDADPVLAAELPPPWIALTLGAVGLLLLLARRTRYPGFSSLAPGDAMPATSAVRVMVRSESGKLGRGTVPGTLSFISADPGAADLAIAGARPVPVRLHSAFTNVDVGVQRRLSGSQPALRVRSDSDDLTLAFASPRERDSAFAALGVEAQRQRAARRFGPASSSRASG